MLSTTTSIVLYKGKKLSDGSHPVCLQVNHSRTNRISLGYKAFPHNWDNERRRFRRNVPNFSDMNNNLRKWQIKAGRIMDEMMAEMLDYDIEFSFPEFKARLLGKKNENDAPKTIIGFLDFYIKLLDEREKLGSRDKYKQLKNILSGFRFSSSMKFHEVNRALLERFETYLSHRKVKGKKIKKVTMNFYMRHFRALYNKAIEFGIAKQDTYPFKNQVNKKGYCFAHLKSPRVSKSLNMDEIELFKQFDYQEHPHLAETWHIFMFLYYAHGMPISDAARLTVENIRNGRIFFGRVKTHERMPSININEKIQSLLDYFDNDGFHLLPILHKKRHETPQQIANRIHKCKGNINNKLKEIASILGIKTKMSTYTSRHTFTNRLLKKGYSIYTLQNLLGHTDTKTTQAYADSFSNTKLDVVDKDL